MSLGCVSNERLKEKLAEALSVIFDINGPELVHQHTHRQSADLLEHDNGGTDGKRSGAEERMSAGWVKKGGTYTPDQTEWSWCFGREKETLGSVAQAILGTVLRL